MERARQESGPALPFPVDWTVDQVDESLVLHPVDDDTPARKDHGASIADDELYEKVRDQGGSKENAAANTSRTLVSRKGGQSESYDDWTVAQLRTRAAEIGVSGRSRMKRAQLIRALRNS